MTPARRPTRAGRRRLQRTRGSLALAAAALAIVTTGLVAGFRVDLYDVAPPGAENQGSELVTTEVVGIRTFTPSDAVTVTTDIVYGIQPDGAVLTLDVCSPMAPHSATSPDATATPTVDVGDLDVGDSDPDEAVLPGPATSTGTETGSAPANAAAPPNAAASVNAQAPELLPAVISVHGGSWARGDKGNSDWRLVCQWLASAGFVAYSVNYRLVPDAVFPAAIDDLQLAVEWMRDPNNAKKYGIDPDRIGAFGGSAGGNLVALLGTRGQGALTTHSRVAAVAELSGPVDLRATGLVNATDGLTRISRAYLGCASINRCAQSVEASASSRLDHSDPPVFIGTSSDEFIPVRQSTDFTAQLERLGIRHELVVVPGNLHSIGILDEAMRARVAGFLHTELGW
ncbi:alpha/beta hydrolase [Cryobacterium sp. PH29-G1]|uniref:alpha/beta hydrolase n=1 Tax=Cryobacterium sp. PH29-G1 TaxID=3046211 RepID=UPI0024B8E0D0|nr:alpha/beta hydrolase [Cryobacterium sp. PH29-G1]MDJ0350362.1 alpha/beta hydrolase [Cryobacterium sp. PH29-G1]